MKQLEVLIIDDDKLIRDLLPYYLDTMAHVHKAADRSEALQVMENQEVDICLVDIELENENGLELLREFKEKFAFAEFIIVSIHTDFKYLKKAMQYGAVDFIAKPFNKIGVVRAIQQTQKYLQLKHRHEVDKRIRELISKPQQGLTENLVYKSEAMHEVMRQVQKLATSAGTSVLLSGETGTGKTLIAQIIHTLSSRYEGPFLPINCSTVPEDIFDTEFFGYRKGAFPHLQQEKIGWFEAASGGTLFLDEVDSLSEEQQHKILKVVNNKKLTKIGGNRKIDVDIRLIAATTKKIKEETTDTSLPLYLHHRLSAFLLYIPPLREHPEDIPYLIDFFKEIFARDLNKTIKSVDKHALKLLKKHLYPGNIRELKSLIERAVILADGPILKPAHFNLKELQHYPKGKKAIKVSSYALDVAQREIIQQALQETDYNKARAARLLNISWQALSRRMKKLNLD